MNVALNLVEKGLVPKSVIRHGIRRLLEARLREQEAIFGPDHASAFAKWIESMRLDDIAPVPEKANEQHYELPPLFFELVLGARRKYSSALYPSENSSLDEAEEHMLAATAERAGLADGQEVLELGCGWGSLTLWMAEKYPNSQILAVSNSAPQRNFIERRARERGLSNVSIVTRDMNEFTTTARFDRVVSVEMFEHMRNWERLLGRVHEWLKPDGRVFLHVFAHKDYAYPFEVKDETDWMSRFFFTGGMMPSVDLVDRLKVPFEVEERWEVNGTHYARTADHWLENLEANRAEVMPVLRETYGTGAADQWYHRWRVFFLACSELFGYADGEEWLVVHQRLRPRTGSPVSE